MWIDPIVEQTRKLRDEYEGAHGYNVHSIIEDLKQWEKDGFPLPVAVNEPIRAGKPVTQAP